MDWPSLTILLVTYKRPVEIRRVVDALLSHLRYSGTLNWHIADDGTPNHYIEDIMEDYPNLNWSFTITDRKGWGANVNEALNAISDDFIFLCEDDYVALRDLNLDQGVALLEALPGVGLVRYDGISAHALNLYLREVETEIGCLDYLLICKDSPHLNVYSHRPHLKHRRFHDHYGLYDDSKPLGEVESGFAHKVKHDSKGPALATLADGVERAFDHVGHSRQQTAEDPNWRPD